MSQDEHFEFVKSLALDLNRQEIKLTSFPDVVVRVRKALDDPDTTSEQLATILSVEPVLTSRVLVLANSTYHNPAGIKVESLDAAIGRIGFEKVRTTAISYAVEELHTAKGLEPLKDELRQTWLGGMRLAAMSEVIAKHCTKLNVDGAFIAGLLNQIGVLYLFSKYDTYPTLLRDPDARQNLIEEWAAPIGESIVTNWDFSEEVRATLNPDGNDDEAQGDGASLVDVVIGAKGALSDDYMPLFDSVEARRLELTQEMMPAVVESFQQKLDSLASAVR